MPPSDGATRVGVDDERLGVVDVMESEGSGNVDTDAGSGADSAAPTLAGTALASTAGNDERKNRRARNGASGIPTGLSHTDTR